jgi:DNA-binding LacI/PurR family transcriptional regulator
MVQSGSGADAVRWSKGAVVGVTLQDVARLAGVSTKTVSNVVHDFPYVRVETRRRVQWAIDELGYRPNLSARGLRSGRTGVIELSVPELRQNYFAELADEVIRAAERRNLGVLVEQTGGDRQREIDVVTGRRPYLADGLLYAPEQLGPEDKDLLSTRLPCVLLGERIFGGPVDHVTMHNTSAAKDAVCHLLGLGRRRIVVMGAHPDGQVQLRAADLRIAGYKQALDEAGVPHDSDLIRVAAPWHHWSGAEAMRELLRSRVQFDGLFCLTDGLALGALREMAAAGVRVPDDVAVVGFDNIDESRFSVPSLTTVDAGRAEIARIAVDLLVERMDEKGQRQPPRLIKPAFRIIRRESTGFVESDDNADIGET